MHSDDRRNEEDYAALLGELGVTVERNDAGDYICGREKPMCDFCSDENPVASVLATDQLVHEIMEDALQSASTGAWAACEACRRLVESRDRNGLLDRAMAVMGPKFRDLPSFLVREQLAAAHDAFWRGHRETN